MFVGWDWASATHDVTVLDDAGAVVDRWAFRHTEQDLAARWTAWPAWRAGRAAGHHRARQRPGRGAAAGRRSPSGARAPHRVLGRPPALGRRPGPSPIPATATSSPTTCAPTGIGCAGWTHPTRPPASCRLWSRLREDHVRARTAASNQLGALLEAHWPGPKPSSPGSAHRSRWPS